MSTQAATLRRDCKVIEIPSGTPSELPAGTIVTIAGFLGSSYTITGPYGMFRVDVKDADALGLTPPAPVADPSEQGVFSEQLVWDQLKTVYDPEIPVNIADLGLIYSCVTTPLETGGKRIDIKMSMTAPGCGMGNVLKADVENKLTGLPDVKEVNVEVVFDPPWNPSLMSEAARLQLGFDI
jgi:probable FeS assembly SUF system protein SufT